MEAVHKRPSTGGFHKILGTRRGALAVAAAAALLAALVLLVFLRQYRAGVAGGAAPVPALVAERLIPKGTSAQAIVSGTYFSATTVPEDQLQEGAVADAGALSGKVATRDVYPGQQLTAGAFARGADPVRAPLQAAQRAMAVPLDSAHGMIGEMRTGDRIDVFGSYGASGGAVGTDPVVRVIARDILVLKGPPQLEGANTEAEGGSNKTSNVLVRVSDRQAAEVALTADTGKVWFVLRPTVGARNGDVSPVSLRRLIASQRSVSVKVKKDGQGGGTVTVTEGSGG